MPITLETAAVIRQVVTQTLFDMMAVQAISNVRLVREPTAVTVKFDTVHATFATVDLFRMVHGEIDLDMEKENLAATGVELFGSAQDHHAVFISGLEQEHRYWFRISVPRRSPAEPLATGHIRSRGEFASLRRDSFVDIEQLHIIDDSDTTSDGDLRFSYALYDASAAGNPRLIEPRFTGELDRASGEDIDSPFGAGVDIGRAPDRMGVYVDGQDDDTNAWAGPWQGLPIVGMRPPDHMPAQASSFSNIGFDGSDALQLFNLKRFLGRHSVPFDFSSAQGALHYSVRGRFITEVSDTLGARATPPWKKITRTKMRLAPDERPAGMVTLHDGWLGLALAPDGVVTRQAAGGSRAWEALDGLDLRELLVQPVADGALVLLGLDREGRPHLARLAHPRRDGPRWRAFDLVASAMPVVTAEGEHGVHVLASDQRGGLWHVRVDRHPGEAVQVAEGIGPIRPVAGVDREGRLVAAFTDQEGELRLVRIGRDGRVEHREGLGRDFAIPLAIVADRAEMLVVAMDAEQRVAARGSELGWESLHSLERLLEGPIARVKLEPIET